MTGREALLVFGALAVVVLLLEGGVRAYYAVTDRAPPSADSAQRDEWDWAREHLAAGKARLPGSAAHDPLLGWVPDRDLDAWVRRGAYGLGDGPIGARTPDRRRVLFVGDSYTFGLYVEPQQAFAFRTGVLLEATETINLGVAGYGPDQMMLMYEANGASLAPDVVVLGFYVRGYFRAQSRFTFFAKPYFVADGQGGFRLEGVPVPTPETVYAQYASGARRIGPRFSYLAASIGASVGRLRATARMHDADAEGWPLMAAIFTRFHHAVTSSGAVPILAIIPTQLDDFDDEVESDLARLACEAADRLDMMCVSLVEPLRAAQDENPAEPVFRDRSVGGHFSVRGHEVAALRIARALTQSR